VLLRLLGLPCRALLGLLLLLLLPQAAAAGEYVVWHASIPGDAG
jgi:hypothetical protein